MIEQADRIERGTTLHADLCVIGAGAAGITIANELAGGTPRVILLESGGEESDAETQDLYAGIAVGAGQLPVGQDRLRFFGGTTNHWEGNCAPLEQTDFTERSWVPNSGWPISRATLDPYYRRAHQICDLGPYDYGRDSWGPLVDPGPSLAADDVEVKLLQVSAPTRFAPKYRAALQAAGNVRVVLRANVYRLVAEANAKTLRHVEVRTLAGNRFVVASRLFVLACGGIENARLLLLSDRASPGGLGNERDLVGRYFMSHVGATPAGVLLYFDAQAERVAARVRRHGVGARTGLWLNAAAQKRERLVNNGLFAMEAMSASALAERGYLAGGQLARSLEAQADFLGRLGPGRDAHRVSVCWINAEQPPLPDSRVTLSERLDALGQPRVVVDWRPPELTYETLRAAAKLYAEAVARAGIGRMKLAPWLLEHNPAWWQRISSTPHHMGSTRMADDPARGVVDPDCKMFGLDNLYVAGSSVFPTSGYVNPTLTLVALAVRLADHLREELASPP